MSKWNYMSIEDQGHSLTLAQGHSDMKIKTCFSQKLLVQICNQISYENFWEQENEN